MDETRRPEMSEQEKCRACEPLPALAAALSANPAENIALCTQHWNRWLTAYRPHAEVLPPCGAHLIKEAE